jgi:hypothetical protein
MDAQQQPSGSKKTIGRTWADLVAEFLVQPAFIVIIASLLGCFIALLSAMTFADRPYTVGFLGSFGPSEDLVARELSVLNKKQIESLSVRGFRKVKVEVHQDFGNAGHPSVSVSGNCPNEYPYPLSGEFSVFDANGAAIDAVAATRMKSNGKIFEVAIGHWGSASFRGRVVLIVLCSNFDIQD